MLMDCSAALEAHIGRRSENIYQRLLDYNLFHLLYKGGEETAYSLRTRFGELPADFMDWANYCDGGLLFDTTLLSLKSRDAELDIPRSTYDEYSRVLHPCGLTDGSVIFAAANYGDLFCFRYKDKDKRTFENGVYQWSRDDGEFCLEWDSFYEWMEEQIDIAEEAIAEDDMDPIPLKLEAEDDYS